MNSVSGAKYSKPETNKTDEAAATDGKAESKSETAAKDKPTDSSAKGQTEDKVEDKSEADATDDELGLDEPLVDEPLAVSVNC